MILLIDIGNTNIKMGLYEDGFKEVITFNRTIKDIPIMDLLQSHKIEGAMLSSVVPSLTPLLKDLIKRELNVEPLVVSHKINTGLRYKIKRPERLGPDRIAAAVGARMLYGGDIIVVSFGTATTFSLINNKNEYLGGAIMPGLEISAAVLAQRTALLPMIKLRAFKGVKRVIGKDTEESILTGVIIGHAGAVERLIRDIKKESGLNPRVIATGGMVDVILPYIKVAMHVNPLLTLEGLRFLYELNVNLPHPRGCLQPDPRKIR